MLFGNVEVDLSTTNLMGVLNVTPDSFSDGGKFLELDRAIEQAIALYESGATFIDIGGESSRPGAKPVSVETEIARTEPLIKAISSELKSKAVISIDTRNRETAERAYRAGATLLNDISALKHDPTMADFAAESGIATVLMHMRDDPATMVWSSDAAAVDRYVYDNVVDEVREILVKSRDFALASGISADRVILDIGLGFGKTVAQNFELIREIDRFSDLGAPILVGASRKSFLGVRNNKGPSDRLLGSLAVAMWCAERGVPILRVHDVDETKEILETLDSIQKS